MACPLGVLVNFSRLGIVPLMTLGILGLVGALGGRILCGWACPFGLLQDLLHRVPTPKFKLPHKLSYTKYFVLLVFVLAVPFFWPKAPYTFCDGCPSSVLESTIPWAFAAHWRVTPGMFNGFTARFFVRGAILLFTLILGSWFLAGSAGCFARWGRSSGSSTSFRCSGSGWDRRSARSAAAARSAARRNRSDDSDEQLRVHQVLRVPA